MFFSHTVLPRYPWLHLLLQLDEIYLPRTQIFLTAESCPKKDFYTPPPPPTTHHPKTCNRLLHCILKIARNLYWILKKACQKSVGKSWQKRRQKRWQERQRKSLFLNLSCCCLETGLKPVLLLLKIDLIFKPLFY